MKWLIGAGIGGALFLLWKRSQKDPVIVLGPNGNGVVPTGSLWVPRFPGDKPPGYVDPNYNPNDPSTWAPIA